MTEFFVYFLLLLVPILTLLVVRVRRRQRILYSLAYLRPVGERSLRELLFRTFQLYYDVASDLLIALLLALILSGILDLSPRRTAVCLDGSYSMEQGGPDAPVDRALQFLADGRLEAGRWRLFLAGFDPTAGRPRLYDLGVSGRAPSLQTLRRRLQSAPGFFSSDPATALQLRRRGYRRVVYLTDRFIGSSAGLEVVEMGETPRAYFYPLSAAYREEEAEFRVRVLRHTYSGRILVSRFDEQKNSYSLVSAPQVAEADSTVSEISIAVEGLYKLTGEKLDFLLQLERPVLEARVEGPFSAMVGELLPGLQNSAAGVWMADLPWNPEDTAALRREVRDKRGILTVMPQADTDALPAMRPYVHSLRDSLSRPVYTELPDELLGLGREENRVFFLDPYRIRDAGTPLAYFGALWHSRPRRAQLRPGRLPEGAKLAKSLSGATSFAYRTPAGTAVINLPPEEFFLVPARAEPGGARQAPAASRPAALLLLVYAAKLLFLALLHRRREQGG